MCVALTADLLGMSGPVRIAGHPRGARVHLSHKRWQKRIHPAARVRTSGLNEYYFRCVTATFIEPFAPSTSGNLRASSDLQSRPMQRI